MKSPGPACSTQFSILLPDNVVEEVIPEEPAAYAEAPAEEGATEEQVYAASEDAEAVAADAEAPAEEPAAQA